MNSSLQQVCGKTENLNSPELGQSSDVWKGVLSKRRKLMA